MILQRLKSDGRIEVGADVARVHILPKNEGPMALVALAPVIVADGLRAVVEEAGGVTTLTVEIEAAMLRVTSGNIKPEDHARIELLVRENLLEASRYPLVRYTGTLEAGWDNAAEVRIWGTLELRGQRRPLDLDFVRKGCATWRASACVHQSHFQIKPITAFLGALRSADCVDIEISVGGDFASEGGDVPPSDRKVCHDR